MFYIVTVATNVKKSSGCPNENRKRRGVNPPAHRLHRINPLDLRICRNNILPTLLDICYTKNTSYFSNAANEPPVQVRRFIPF